MRAVAFWLLLRICAICVRRFRAPISNESAMIRGALPQQKSCQFIDSRAMAGHAGSKAMKRSGHSDDMPSQRVINQVF